MPAKFCQYEVGVRFRLLGEKLYFCYSSSKPFAFFAVCVKGQTRCPKDYDGPRGLCTGQICDIPSVTGLLRIHARLHRPLCLFCLPRFRASRQPITSFEFKFVTRQVVASVVIRASKLKFAAESRTRVYFPQHVASTCNTVFCCKTSWSQTW